MPRSFVTNGLENGNRTAAFVIDGRSFADVGADGSTLLVTGVLAPQVLAMALQVGLIYLFPFSLASSRTATNLLRSRRAGAAVFLSILWNFVDSSGE